MYPSMQACMATVTCKHVTIIKLISHSSYILKACRLTEIYTCSYQYNITSFEEPCIQLQGHVFNNIKHVVKFHHSYVCFTGYSLAICIYAL